MWVQETLLTCAVGDIHKTVWFSLPIPFPTIKLYIVVLDTLDHKDRKAKWVLQEEEAQKEKKASMLHR